MYTFDKLSNLSIPYTLCPGFPRGPSDRAGGCPPTSSPGQPWPASGLTWLFKQKPWPHDQPLVNGFKTLKIFIYCSPIPGFCRQWGFLGWIWVPPLSAALKKHSHSGKFFFFKFHWDRFKMQAGCQGWGWGAVLLHQAWGAPFNSRSPANSAKESVRVLFFSLRVHIYYFPTSHGWSVSGTWTSWTSPSASSTLLQTLPQDLLVGHSLWPPPLGCLIYNLIIP